MTAYENIILFSTSYGDVKVMTYFNKVYQVLVRNVCQSSISIKNMEINV